MAPPARSVAYRRILVPLDGSPASEEALPLAVAIARFAGGTLLLAHVREDIDVAAGLPELFPATLAGDPRIPEGVDVESIRLEGTVAEALLAHADEAGADLVVMTSRGRGGLGRALFGSVTTALLRKSAIPVLIARGGADTAPGAEAGPHGPPFRRILLPLDGSERAEQVIPFAFALAGTTGVHYILLRVRPALLPDGGPEPGPLLPLPAEPEADGYLSAVASRIDKGDVLVSTRSVTHARDAESIIRQADADDVDLVALTTRGAGAVERLIFGSVSDAVIRGVACSVLVVRAGRVRPAS